MKLRLVYINYVPITLFKGHFNFILMVARPLPFKPTWVKGLTNRLKKPSIPLFFYTFNIIIFLV